MYKNKTAKLLVMMPKKPLL